LADSFQFDNLYGSSEESWQKYFQALTHPAALARGK